MPQKFLVKRSSVEDKVPAAGDLDTGELALNLKDQKLYSKDADGNVFEIGKEGDTPNLQAVLDEGNTSTTDLGISNGAAGVTLSNTGDVQASNILRAGGIVGGYFTGSTLGGNGVLSILNRAGGNLIEAAYHFGGDITGIVVDQYGNINADGGVTASFGTSALQQGNVAPLNDWSCYPARSTIYSAPPASQPEPVDPGFGVDKPTFSGGFTSGAIVTGGIVGTQDIIDLEGE